MGPRRRRARHAPPVLALLAVVLVLALGACGSSSSSSTAGSGAAAQSATTGTMHLAKTKFVLHAALAFGAFHHWIWNPYRAGDFKHPFSHKLTLIKAALAAGFTYHELRLALQAARADPTLSKLVAPVTALQNRLHDLSSQIKGGGNATALSQDNSAIDAVKGQSAGAGQPIQEQVPATP